MFLASIAVALAFWGTPAQCPGGGPTAYHVKQIAGPALGVYVQHPAGWCEVQIDARRWRWWQLCSVLVHEQGHAVGFRDPVGYRRKDGTRDHDHSPDPGSVMYPSLERAADACRGNRPARYRRGTTITLRPE